VAHRPDLTGGGTIGAPGLTVASVVLALATDHILIGVAVLIFAIIAIVLLSSKRRTKEEEEPSAPSPTTSSIRSTSDSNIDYSAVYDEAFRTGDYQGAARAAARLHDRRRYGEALERAGDVERAIAAWIDADEPDRAAELLKKNNKLSRAGKLYLELGRPAEAADCFVEAKQPDLAARAFREMGDEQNANLHQAHSLVLKGQHIDAARFYVAAGYMLRAAQQLLAGGDVPKAVEALRRSGRSQDAAKLLAKTGDHDAAGRLFEEAEHFAEAAEEYHLAGDAAAETRCLARSGHGFEAGRQAFERGEYDVAMNYLSEVKPLDDRYTEAALLRGQIHERRGDQPQAAKAYGSFLDTRPPDDRNKVLFLRVAQIKEGLGEVKQALHILGRVITAGLGTPDVTIWASRLEDTLGRTPEAAGPEPTEAFETTTGEIPLRQRTSRISAPRTRARSGVRARSKEPTRARRVSEPVPISLPKQVTNTASDPPAIAVLKRRYKFFGQMGQGGNGVVYRAEDRALGRQVVVKFLHQALLPTDVARKYFRREAKTAASLSHPNIVTIFDVGEEGGTMYFSMEMVDGDTLADLIIDSGGRLSHAQALPIIKQLCSALDYAHGRQVIHRDIKPGNIMVTRDGTVKLLDFGLAKALDENPDRSVFLCGTPFYMSPEQIRRDFLDHRTDIYSLGCLLYVMYTGDVPFPDGNIFYHQQKTAPPNAESLADGLPPGIGQVLLRAVEKDREQRFQQAGEVAAALEAAAPLR
jgi:tRNA A-37 threonylcarbamoyl transferase component Bud32/tetratricopeptide (TPR) repeat protein